MKRAAPSSPRPSMPVDVACPAVFEYRPSRLFSLKNHGWCCSATYTIVRPAENVNNTELETLNNCIREILRCAQNDNRGLSCGGIVILSAAKNLSSLTENPRPIGVDERAGLR